MAEDQCERPPVNCEIVFWLLCAGAARWMTRSIDGRGRKARSDEVKGRGTFLHGLTLDHTGRRWHVGVVLHRVLENFLGYGREFLPGRGLIVRNAHIGKPRVSRGFFGPPIAFGFSFGNCRSVPWPADAWFCRVAFDLLAADTNRAAAFGA